MRNNSVHLQSGDWHIHWRGTDVPIKEETAHVLKKQKVMSRRVIDLEGDALDWAVAKSLGYFPMLQVESVLGTLLKGGRVSRGYEAYYTVATLMPQVRYGDFRPQTYAVGGPILDEYRISTEIADNESWTALIDTQFNPDTRKFSVIGKTRLEAGLRCLVLKLQGEMMDIPAELITPDLRLRAVEGSL